MRRVAARATVLIVVVALVSGIGAVLGVAPARAGGYVPADEMRVRTLLNDTRSSKGLARLASDDQLIGMARRQAGKMAAKGSIFHNLKLGDEMTSSSLNWLKAGENVGLGPNVDLIEDAFLASPHHYENIVDPSYDTVGIGVVDGADGRRYVVQVFADMGAAAPAPKAAEPKPAAQQSTTEAKPPAAAGVAPVSQTPTLSAEPTATPMANAPKPPSVVPNVIIGGVVEPLDLAFLGTASTYGSFGPGLHRAAAGSS